MPSSSAPAWKRAAFCLCLLVVRPHPAGGGDVPRARGVAEGAEDDDPRARAWNEKDADGAAAAAATTTAPWGVGSDEVLPATAETRSAGRRLAHLRQNNTARATPEGTRGRGIFRKALGKAIGGGIPGAIAGVVQVLSLMWLRTVINYQYRYGSSFFQALSTLYGMGGIPRLYSGVQFALIHAPLSRFVSTAANDGVAALLQHLHWGPGREVVVAALTVGCFRMLLMPIDTCKTVMQIEGRGGLAQILAQVRRGRASALYAGAVANAASSILGHYPWFYIHNLLSRNQALARTVSWATGRNALIGFVSSIVSDTVANFMRVIKTTKQSLGSVRSDAVTYAEAVGVILAADGLRGLFCRGLQTRLLGNAIQSVLFTVVWRGLSERWKEKNAAAEEHREHRGTETTERRTTVARENPDDSTANRSSQ